MKSFVVDTNVAVVANNRCSPQADAGCVLACVDTLDMIARQGRILLDDQYRILKEYTKIFNISGQPGLGDVFVKWVLTHQSNCHKCEKVVIHPRGNLGEDYEEFPCDPDLNDFDPSDKKFVAVALGSRSKPEVLNAVDSDWWNCRVALKRNGVKIKFLCPQQFH